VGSIYFFDSGVDGFFGVFMGCIWFCLFCGAFGLQINLGIKGLKVGVKNVEFDCVLLILKI